MNKLQIKLVYFFDCVIWLIQDAVNLLRRNNIFICGFYKRETHHIIPLEECFIQTTYSTEIVKFAKNVLCEFGAVGYNERFDSGSLRHILVRKNHNEDEFMIVLIVKTIDFIKENDLKLAIEKIIKRGNIVK